MDLKIAIIPARGGSKRIPKKNSKSFLGKPILSYSIETALNSKLFDEVMVSTEDPEIAEISKRCGASIPFLRSKETSSDTATTFEVIEEVLTNYKELGKEFTYTCCIYPTAPFVSFNTLNDGFKKLIKGNYDVVFPVVKYSFPIQRALRINNGTAAMIQPEHLVTRSQDLQPSYHDAGQFYWCQTKRILNERKILTAHSGVIEISEMEGQDIDNPVDWKLAELKYQLLKKNEAN